MDNYRYSIITAAFNSEKTLSETIKSVRNIKDDYLEYIIVYTASKDKTLDIIKDNIDIVDKLIHIPKLGIYPSINKGIKESNGELICILNSDDLIYKDCLNSIYRIYKKKNKKLFFTYGEVDLIDEDSLVIGKKGVVSNFRKNKFNYRRMPFPHLSCVISKQTYISQGLYNERFKAAADLDLILRLIKNKIPSHKLEFKLGAYRIGGVSANLFTRFEAHNVRVMHGINYVKSIFYLIRDLVASAFYLIIKNSKFSYFLYPSNYNLQLIDDINLDGGAQRLLLDICSYSKNKFLILYFKKSSTGSLKEFSKFSRIVQINLLDYFFCLLILKLKKKNFYCIHSHLSKGFYFGLLIPSKKKIYTEHNSWNKRRKFFLTKLLDPFLYSKYDHIICISEGVKKSLMKFLGNNLLLNEPRLIYNWVNPVFLNSKDFVEENIERKIKEMRNGPIKSVMIGSFTKQKLQRDLLNLLKTFPNLELIFVGDGYLRNELVEEIKLRNLKERVVFTGSIPSNEIYQILTKCHIYLHSVAWEGFGIAPLEAMSLGIPVIASNVLGLSEVVNSKDFLVDSFSEFKVLKLLRKLIKDPSFYRSNSIFFYRQSLKFSLKKSINEYDEFYSFNNSKQIT